ncbi:hypothetical protein [Terrarubrum flagellatum]|uniref:hypothetical protein n=1 Tax=Terrirubrum flagellatum TaxID=2895980 RepID=UPI003144E24B
MARRFETDLSPGRPISTSRALTLYTPPARRPGPSEASEDCAPDAGFVTLLVAGRRRDPASSGQAIARYRASAILAEDDEPILLRDA